MKTVMLGYTKQYFWDWLTETQTCEWELKRFYFMYYYVASNVWDADYFLPMSVCLSLDLNQQRRL